MNTSFLCLCSMSTNDLFTTELPSDDESDDEDYVTENEGSSDEAADLEEESKMDRHSYKQELRRVRAGKHFGELVRGETEKLDNESHPDVLIDPLWLEFQQPAPFNRTLPTEDTLRIELSKYSNITPAEQPVDVLRFKRLARGSLKNKIFSDPTNLAEAVAAARAGLANAQVDVDEEVRFAGEVVRMKRTVERTSSHAARFEKRKQRDNLGGVQEYLNELKSKRTVSSVEKSSSEWSSVKMKDQALEQALKADRGFLEKRAFLVRTDVREDDLRRDARRRAMAEKFKS